MTDIFAGIDGGQLLMTLLLLLLIFQQKRIGTFLNLSKIALRRTDWQPVARHELPDHVRHLLGTTGQALQPLGFEYVAALAQAPYMVADPREQMFAELYWQPESGVVARVELPEASSGQPTKVQFMTPFSDGTLLATVNREKWAQLPIPPEIQLVDAYADDLAGQWQAHREALAQCLGQRQPLTDKQAILKQQAAFGFPRWLQRLEQLRWAYPRPDGHYQLTLRAAWQLSHQITNRPAAAAAALTRPYRADPAPTIAAQRLAEMDTVAANLALAGQPLSPHIKRVLFGTTLLLSILFFGWLLGPFDAAAILLVLLIHELGHLLAMQAFGYRNLAIFFVPLLGAAATGYKPHATPWQESLVLLAGPVPGLLLAAALLYYPAEGLPLPAIEFIRAFVNFSVWINLFNLLPFGVLDGGRLVQLVVLGRFPRIRALFAALGAIIGLGFAVWSQAPLLGVAMLLLLVSIPLQLKAAGLITTIRKQAARHGQRSLSAPQVLRALGKEFSRKEFDAVGIKGWTQRLSIAQLAYPRLLQGVPARGVTLAVMGLHTMALVVPIAWTLWSWFDDREFPLLQPTAVEQQRAAQEKQERQQQRRAELALDPEYQAMMVKWEAFQGLYQQQSDPAVRWQMLEKVLEEEDFYYYDDDEESARQTWLEQQYAAVTQQLPADHPARIEEQIYAIDDREPTAETQLTTVIDLLTRSGGRPLADLDDQQQALLVSAYVQLSRVAPTTMARHRADLDALWAALQPPRPVEARMNLAQLRAHIAFQADQLAEAEQWMERFRAHSDEEMEEWAATTYGWYLIESGQAARAAELANNGLNQGDETNDRLRQHTQRRWLELAGWAAMVQGDPRAADSYFQQVQTQQQERLDHALEEQPYWLQLISAVNRPATRLNAATLDHLAALQQYDPPQAQELSNTLQPEGNEPRPYLANYPEYWGTVRAETHARLLTELGYPPQEQEPEPEPEQL